eukprot:UN22652
MATRRTWSRAGCRRGCGNCRGVEGGVKSWAYGWVKRRNQSGSNSKPYNKELHSHVVLYLYVIRGKKAD